MNTALNTIISFSIGGLLTFFVGRITFYKRKFKAQDLALLNLLKNQLTEIFYKYNKEKTLPDYVYQNFLDMLQAYEDLGGNSYIHTIATKMEQWETTKTDIL